MSCEKFCVVDFFISLAKSSTYLDILNFPHFHSLLATCALYT